MKFSGTIENMVHVLLTKFQAVNKKIVSVAD